MMAHLFEIFIYATSKTKSTLQRSNSTFTSFSSVDVRAILTQGGIFLAKWLDISEDVSEFMEYFNAQWFVKEPFWFEGYNPASIFGFN